MSAIRINQVAALADTLADQAAAFPQQFRNSFLTALRSPAQGGIQAGKLLQEAILLQRGRLRSDPYSNRDGLRTTAMQIPKGLSKHQTYEFRKIVFRLASRIDLPLRVIAKQLNLEFQLLQAPEKVTDHKATFPSTSMILRNLEEKNAFEIRQTFDQIIDKFKKHPAIAQTAATLVMYKKFYADADEALKVYRSILKRARLLFGKADNARNLALTATCLVFARIYPSIESAHQRYVGIQQAAEKVFGQDPATSSIVDTAAGHVFMKRYHSIAEAKVAYDNYRQQALKIFGRTGENRELALAAARMVFAKKYKSIEDALKQYDRIVRIADAKKYAGDPVLKNIRGTLIHKVFTKATPSIAAAARNYKLVTADVRQYFGSDPELQSIIGTATHLIFNGAYKNARQAGAAYIEIYNDALSQFGDISRSRSIVKTVAKLVFGRIYKSVTEAKLAHLKIQKDLKKFTDEHTEIRYLQISLATQLLSRQFPDILTAVKAQLPNWRPARA